MYKAQQENPVKGDWVQLLEKDLEMLGMVLNEEKVKELSKAQYKIEIKSRVKSVVLEVLQKKQEGHTKIKHIKYDKLSMQNYLKSHMFNNHEASMLISLRSRTTREFAANFPYNINQMCPMECITEDTPEHILVCDHLKSEETRYPDIQYEHIFSDKQQSQNYLLPCLRGGKMPVS